MRTTSTMSRVFLLGFLIAVLTSSPVNSATTALPPPPDTSTSTAAPAQNTDSTAADAATEPTPTGNPASSTPAPQDTSTGMENEASTGASDSPGATGSTMVGGDTSGSMSSSPAPVADSSTDAPSATDGTTAEPDSPSNTTTTAAPENTDATTMDNNTSNTESTAPPPETTTMDASMEASTLANTATSASSNSTTADSGSTGSSPAPATDSSSTPAPPDATPSMGTTTMEGGSSETEPSATSPTVPSPSESSTEATTATTPTVPPTTTPAPKYPFMPPEGYFVLTLKFGSDDVLSCNPCDNAQIKKEVQTAFADIPGFLFIGEQEMQRRKRETVITLSIVFDPAKLLAGLNQTERETKFEESINALDNKAGISVNTTQSPGLASDFAEQTKSMCNLIRPCQAQYMCDEAKQTCVHRCETETCSGNGQCQVEVVGNGDPRAVCKCNSGYETTYTGDKCEESETSMRKKIAIVAGVLGTFCAILILIVIVLYCRQRGFGDNSSKYELSGRRGYSNSAYSDDVNMKKMG